jgi:hypothetical protein
MFGKPPVASGLLGASVSLSPGGTLEVKPAPKKDPKAGFLSSFLSPSAALAGCPNMPVVPPNRDPVCGPEAPNNEGVYAFLAGSSFLGS